MYAHEHARSPVRVPAHVAAQPSPARSEARKAARSRPASDRPSSAQLRALQRLAAGRDQVAAGPSAVLDVLRRPGRPLPVAVRQEMEASLGADLADVRLHTDQAAQRSAVEIGARAYTSGHHVVLGEGGGDRRTLAHELSHVIQQRRGPVAGTDNGSGLKLSDPSDRFEREADATAARVLQGPYAIERTDVPEVQADSQGGDGVLQRAMPITFDPFNGGRLVPEDFSGQDTDELINHGLQYSPGGGTAGNELWLEEMLNDTGGGSSPGEPKDIEKMRLADRGLVRARGQENAATAMHAINGDFVDGANDTAYNIFMGSALSNTQEHFHKVERPIRASMQSGTNGWVDKYEDMMDNVPPFSFGAHMLGWNAPGWDIPGASSAPTKVGPHQKANPGLTMTHVLDKNELTKKPPGRLPRLIYYRVTPNYDYLPYPAWPQFLKDNLQEAEDLVDAELAKPLAAQDTDALQNEEDAIAILKAHAHDLFPATFTCEADYYIASYDRVNRWYHSRDVGEYDAEA
jgi:hypothetical protein